MVLYLPEHLSSLPNIYFNKHNSGTSVVSCGAGCELNIVLPFYSVAKINTGQHKKYTHEISIKTIELLHAKTIYNFYAKFQVTHEKLKKYTRK